MGKYTYISNISKKCCDQKGHNTFQYWNYSAIYIIQEEKVHSGLTDLPEQALMYQPEQGYCY